MNSQVSQAGLWEQLLADRSCPPGFACLRPTTAGACDMFLAVHKPDNRLAVLLEVPAPLVADIAEYPSSRGFFVEVQPIEHGRQGRVRLVLSPTSPLYNDLFRVLVDDIVGRLSAVLTEHRSVQLFLDRLHHWQAFFQRNSVAGLSQRSQQGLYGELLTLKLMLAPHIGISGAIASWTGPFGTNQDFELGDSAVETKTSSSNTQQKIHISNARQLETVGVDSLFISFWSLDIRRGTRYTLPKLVDDVRAMAIGDSAANDMFTDKLLASGYLDIHKEKYSRSSYRVRAHSMFRVVEAFPRIDTRSLCSGVGDVRYTIELTACEPFRVVEGDFLSVLGRVNG